MSLLGLETSIYSEAGCPFPCPRLLQALSLPSPNSASPIRTLATAQRPLAPPSQKGPAGMWLSCSRSNTQATPGGEHIRPKLLIGHILFKCYQCHFPVCVSFLFLFCFYSSLLILTVNSNCLPCGMKISQAYVNSLSLWNSWLSLESP